MISLHKRHATIIQQHLQIPAFATQFLDPPFNQLPKIMGWIDAEQCSTVTVPKWEAEEEQDAESPIEETV